MKCARMTEKNGKTINPGILNDSIQHLVSYNACSLLKQNDTSSYCN